MSHACASESVLTAWPGRDLAVLAASVDFSYSSGEQAGNSCAKYQICRLWSGISLKDRRLLSP